MQIRTGDFMKHKRKRPYKRTITKYAHLRPLGSGACEHYNTAKGGKS